jgi:hypothetical protein
VGPRLNEAIFLNVDSNREDSSAVGIVDDDGSTSIPGNNGTEETQPSSSLDAAIDFTITNLDCQKVRLLLYLPSPIESRLSAEILLEMVGKKLQTSVLDDNVRSVSNGKEQESKEEYEEEDSQYLGGSQGANEHVEL